MKALILIVVLACACCDRARAEPPKIVPPQSERELAERMRAIDAYCLEKGGCRLMTIPEHDALQRELDQLLDRLRELEKPNLPSGMKCA